MYLLHTKLGTKIKFSFHHQCFSCVDVESTLWMNTNQKNTKSDGISFVFALCFSFSLSFLASLHSIFVFDCENKYSEFRFYSHALVSMNNEGCWFCENKNVDTTQHQHKEPKWEKEQKKWLLLKNQFNMVGLSSSLYFSSVFFVCFFPVVFYRWFFDSKPFCVCERIHSVYSARVSQTKSSHFLTAFDLILLSRQFYLFVCEQIATLTRTRTHSKIKCNQFQFLLSYTVTVPCECLCHFLIYGISTSRNNKEITRDANAQYNLLLLSIQLCAWIGWNWILDIAFFLAFHKYRM